MEKYPHLRRTLLGGAVALAALGANSASADVRYQQTVSLTAGGLMAGFSSEMQVTTHISKDRARSEVVGTGDSIARVPESAHIMRLDRETTYELNPAKQTYREVTLEEMREQMSELRAELEENTGGQALPVATDSCVWSEARFRTRKTKERERIAGIRATRHILTMTQSCDDESTGASCDMEWSMEPWFADRVPDHDEVQAFYESLAEKLAMDTLIPQMPGASQMLLGMFPNRWESLLDEMEDIEGYPLRNVMALKIGGRSCMTASGVQIAQDEIWSNVGDAAYNSVIDSSGRATSRAVTDAARDSMGDSIGGAIGSSAVGAATGELIGGLAGMFKKKKEKPASKPQPTSDEVTVFRITTEVTEWDREALPDSAYEVPEGWTRVE